MRKFKMFLPLIAVLITVAGVFAMKAHKTESSSKYDTYYYHYIPSTTSLSQYQDEGSWVQTTTPDQEACGGGTKPCIVESAQSSVGAFVATITTESDVETNPYATKP